VEARPATSSLFTAAGSRILANCNKAADYLFDADFITDLCGSRNIIVMLVIRLKDQVDDELPNIRVTGDMITTIAMNSGYAAGRASIA
jgi:hypothetical protein